MQAGSSTNDLLEVDTSERQGIFRERGPIQPDLLAKGEKDGANEVALILTLQMNGRLDPRYVLVMMMKSHMS